jgi:hypothetical protein
MEFCKIGPWRTFQMQWQPCRKKLDGSQETVKFLDFYGRYSECVANVTKLRFRCAVHECNLSGIYR